MKYIFDKLAQSLLYPFSLVLFPSLHFPSPCPILSSHSLPSSLPFPFWSLTVPFFSRPSSANHQDSRQILRLNIVLGTCLRDNKRNKQTNKHSTHGHHLVSVWVCCHRPYQSQELLFSNRCIAAQ